MSCRIDRAVGTDNLAVLFISGQITGEHVQMLQDVLEHESGGFSINLKNVHLVDRDAVKLLATVETNGIDLNDCPAYIREWITRERAQETADRPDQGTGAREDIEDV